MQSILNRMMYRRGYLLFERLNPHLPDHGKLLDVGSGTGHNAKIIEDKMELDVTELDVTDMNTLGRPVTIYDGLNIPFKDRAFDCVMMLFALHYVANPTLLLKELHRVSSQRILLLQSTWSGAWGKSVLHTREWMEGRGAFRIAQWSGGRRITE